MVSTRLAIIGARGLGNHGGFETFVAELAPRLGSRGYEVFCSVRCSRDCCTSPRVDGITLMDFPFMFPKSYAIGKMFEVLYDSYFVLKCKLVLECEVVYCLGVASGLSLLLTKRSNTFSVVNVDGLEWTRSKFGGLTRFFLRCSFVAACMGANRIVIDNRQLTGYIPERHRRKAIFIPYGSSQIDGGNASPGGKKSSQSGNATSFGDDYWLVVARLEPENNIHTILEAYLRSRSLRPIVIVGGCSSPRYERRLSEIVNRMKDGKNAIMAGPTYNQERLAAIRKNCAAYVHGHSVGGTNPSLLEAMSAGNVIIAHDNPFNREVCADTAMYFQDVSTLTAIMNEIESASVSYAEMGQMARVRVGALYAWKDVVSKHDLLFTERNQSL